MSQIIIVVKLRKGSFCWFLCENLLKSANVWSLPHLRNFNEAERASSKFICTVTLTSSRALVRSPSRALVKSPVEWFVSEKSWSEKSHRKITQNKLLLKTFLQLDHNLQNHWKKPPLESFSDYFWKDSSEYSFVSDHWQSNSKNCRIWLHIF